LSESERFLLIDNNDSVHTLNFERIHQTFNDLNKWFGSLFKPLIVPIDEFKKPKPKQNVSFDNLEYQFEFDFLKSLETPDLDFETGTLNDSDFFFDPF